MRVAGRRELIGIGILLAVQAAAQEYTISTFAGGAPPATPAPAVTASLGNTWNVVADATGNVYFSTGSNSVFKLDTAGTLTLVAGNSRWGYSGDGGPATSAQLRNPQGLALDDAGNLYIADSRNNVVRRVSPSGIITTVAGTGAPGFAGDDGPATAARLCEPKDVAVDSAGNPYISDAGNNRIRRVSAGIITTVAGNGSSGFSGDGGPATSAQLFEPASVALDSAGNLYIGDTWNNRIRRVSAPSPFQQPIISTIAGDGTDQYSGDGGPATSAGLYGPGDIALDGSGRLYFTTWNAVRMLTPVSACAPSATPNAFTAPVSGGQLVLNIQAAAGCAWTITGIPARIAASATSGSGSASVTLSSAANTGAARSATIAAAVSATAGCSWTAASPVSWVTITSGAVGTGNGAVDYAVQPSSSGVTRSTAITVAGRTFTVEQRTGLVAAGTMAHLASGGSWKTTFTLFNNGATAALARLTFIGDNGAKLTLPLAFPQLPGAPPVQAGIMEPLLNPGETLIVESEVPAAQDAQQGWAELLTDGAITAFGVFRQRIGEHEQEAVVPLETRVSASYVLAFDNTGGIDTGVAVTNVAAQAANLSVSINDDTGRHIQTSQLTLPARGHRAFVLHSKYPAVAGRRGTIKFLPPAGGQISVLGLRFNVPKGGAFTTIPVWAP
jgi:sugar lactone lactonase YvrE